MEKPWDVLKFLNGLDTDFDMFERSPITINGEGIFVAELITKKVKERPDVEQQSLKISILWNAELQILTFSAMVETTVEKQAYAWAVATLNSYSNLPGEGFMCKTHVVHPEAKPNINHVVILCAAEMVVNHRILQSDVAEPFLQLLVRAIMIRLAIETVHISANVGMAYTKPESKTIN